MGCGGTGGSLPTLLPLDASDHPNAREIFRTGNIEDDYEVVKEPIARGKFASVRLARHRVTGEAFAAKFIRRRRAANLEEARHEVAVLLLGRSDPHIVHLHQVYETKSEYIIILEFGEGGDLQRLLDDRGKLPEKTVQDLLRQVLKGLEFLHMNHVAHLDIKPQNLILMGPNSEDGVKLVDFGLSRVIHKDTELTQIMGTPDYVAPEVINFEPVGLATDMWSIGVLTYVLLTGYTPFGGETDQETFVNITQGEFDFPDEYFGDVSDLAKDFISGLLIKSINKRMTVAQCAAHPWLCDIFDDPHRLSQLSEADSADSGYSTDLCSGSPPSPGSLPNGYVSDLCQFSIPEEQQIFSPHPPLHEYNKQYRPHRLHRLGEEELDRSQERRPRASSGQLSINVIECLQAQQKPQSKPHRRSSLVIPRYTTEYDSQNQFRNSDLQNGDSFYDYINHQDSSRSSHNHYDSNSSSNLNSWNQHPHGSIKGLSQRNQSEKSSLLNMARPWNNICNGIYSRALHQLSNPKKSKPKSNLGLRPELSCSMIELKHNYDNNNTFYTDPKLSKHELRKSKAELRASKKDLRGQNLDMGSSRDLRGSRYDMRGSALDLKLQNADHRSSISDMRGMKSDLRSSKHDLRGTRMDLRNSDSRSSKQDLRSLNKDAHDQQNLLSSHNFPSIQYLNMSLSRLDIAHETLDKNDSEERDVVYGDCTLPRRFSRNNANISPMFGGNSFHMSFRRPKKRDSKI